MRDVRVYAELRTFVKAWRKFACVLEAGERACVHLSLSLFPSLSLSVPTYACACDRMRPRCSERCCAQQRWQLLLSLSLSLSIKKTHECFYRRTTEATVVVFVFYLLALPWLVDVLPRRRRRLANSSRFLLSNIIAGRVFLCSRCPRRRTSWLCLAAQTRLLGNARGGGRYWLVYQW
jgi:hypothetical protein